MIARPLCEELEGIWTGHNNLHAPGTDSVLLPGRALHRAELPFDDGGVNLGQEPGLFVANAQVKALLDTDGEAALPAVFADGELQSSGRFPTRDELASWAGVELPTESAEVSRAVIVELAAIGAATGANCEPCFKYHYAEARKLGLTKDDLVLAVRTAQTVKDVPAATVLDTAARLLGVDTAALGAAPLGAGAASDSTSRHATCSPKIFVRRAPKNSPCSSRSPTCSDEGGPNTSSSTPHRPGTRCSCSIRPARTTTT